MKKETKSVFKILKTIAKNSEETAKEKASVKLGIPTKLLQVTTNANNTCYIVTPRD